MIQQSVIDILSKIAARYSYVAKSRKYMDSVAKEMVTIDQAVAETLSKFATEHPTDYTPVAGNRAELEVTIRECIKDATKVRKERQLNRASESRHSGTMSTSLNGRSTSNPAWKPVEAFNAIDAAWCSGISYCPVSNTLYATLPSGALEVIGVVGDNATISKLTTMLTVKPHEYIQAQLNSLRDLYFTIQVYEQDGADRMLAVTLGNGQTLREYLGIKEGDRVPQTVDEIATRIIHYMLNSTLPASVFTGLAKLTVYHESFTDDSGNEHSSVQGYYYDMGKQGFMTAKAYFTNIIENYIEYLPRIELPAAIRYDGQADAPSFGIWNQAEYDADMNKYAGLSLDDSQIVRTYLSPMTSEQKNFVVAWWYALVHAHDRKMLPSLLQMDKGGTLKNTVANIVKMAMTRYYGCDCHYDLKQEQLNVPQYTYNSSTQKSLGDAVWCHYDEVATKGRIWDEFKAMTGGPTVDVSIKKLYSNPYTQKSSVVFFFASNKPVYITDMGAFKRRLAIISTKGDNTYKSIPVEYRNRMNSDTDIQLREFCLLMKLGKSAYNLLVKKYGGLIDAACSLQDIASELDSSSPWDEYYEGFYASLFQDNYVKRTITNADLSKLFIEYKGNHPTSLTLDENGMRRFCANAHPDNAKTYVWSAEERRSIRGWKLNAPVYERTDDMEEYRPIECTTTKNLDNTIPWGKASSFGTQVPTFDLLNECF